MMAGKLLAAPAIRSSGSDALPNFKLYHRYFRTS